MSIAFKPVFDPRTKRYHITVRRQPTPAFVRDEYYFMDDPKPTLSRLRSGPMPRSWSESSRGAVVRFLEQEVLVDEARG